MAKYDDIVISSGHAKYVPGAGKYIDEVTEARKVVNQVADYFKKMGDNVDVFHDDTSKDKSTNLKTIVRFHNSKQRQLDISVHFNAGGGEGTEVLYLTAEGLAKEVSEAISKAGGFKNRGAKKRTDLYFLNQTDKEAILIEVCFVDSKTDVEKYQKNFLAICKAIAETISGEKIPAPKPVTPVIPTKPKNEPVLSTSAMYRVYVDGVKIGAFKDPSKAIEDSLKKNPKDIKIERV